MLLSPTPKQYSYMFILYFLKSQQRIYFYYLVDVQKKYDRVNMFTVCSRQHSFFFIQQFKNMLGDNKASLTSPKYLSSLNKFSYFLSLKLYCKKSGLRISIQKMQKLAYSIPNIQMNQMIRQHDQNHSIEREIKKGSLGITFKNKCAFTFIVYYNINLRRKSSIQKMIPAQYYSYPFNQYLAYPNYEYVKLPLKCSYYSDQEYYNVKVITPQFKNCSQGKANQNKGDRLEKKIQAENIQKKGKLEKGIQFIKKSADKYTVDQQIQINYKNDQLKDKLQIQKDGRNANSNLLRMFFRTLDQKLQDKKLINNIILKNKLKTDYRKFTDWFEINRVEYKNYIRLPSVKKLFFGKKYDDHTKIMRILLRDFLKTQAFCFYLTSKKIKKTMMSFNYRSIRLILQEIMEI